MTDSAMPSFSSVSAALNAFGALGNPSEIHGLLTALFCASASIRLEGWIASLMSQKIDQEDKIATDSKQILHNLFEQTEEALNSEEYSFTILVPDDSESFTVRIESFAYWCQGFIAGLNLVGVQLKEQTIPEVQEALDDLVKFSCLRYDEEEAGDETSEQAYAELLEYARVAVMLLYTEKHLLVGGNLESPGNDTVH